MKQTQCSFSQIIWLFLILGIAWVSILTACTPTSEPPPTSVNQPLLTSTPTLAVVATIPITIAETALARYPLPIPTLPPTANATITNTLTIPFTATPTPEPYVIKAGDTLLDIAATQDVNYNDFLSINNINNPDTHIISVGDSLFLPPQGHFEQPDQQITYLVKEGDTFTLIADTYGIPLDVLIKANPDIETPENLRSGYELAIPWGGIHFVSPGETFGEIAVRYEVTMEELVTANAKKYPDLSLNTNYIQAGWRLEIPSRDENNVIISGDYDCSPQPSQTKVITHTVENGERLICLSSKFNVSETTLLNANPNIWGDGGLTDGTTLLIPPSNGALYTLTADDVANDVNLEDLGKWYDYHLIGSILDWEGQIVSMPLQIGQQIFMPNTDPQSPPFDVAIAKGLAQPTAIPSAIVSNPVPDSGQNDTSEEPSVPIIAASGDNRGIHYRWWDGEYGKSSAGYCPYTVGAGWSNTLTWPVTGRTIYENRGFKAGHNGIDIIMPIGSPVYAAASGTVIWAGYSPFGGGFLVFLAHGNGWRTAYAHLSSVNVNCGDVISQGGLLGLSGDTATYFPHLHLEVVNGNAVQDPFLWLPNEAVYIPRP